MPRADRPVPPPQLVALGRAVRGLREKRDLLQIEVAAQTGLAEAQISDIELSKTNPTWITLLRVIDGLGCSLVEFAEAVEGETERG